MHNTDIVLINPGDRRKVFQELGIAVSAIEPPFWIAVLAAFLQKQGYSVNIIDSNAEALTAEETANRVRKYSPLLTAVIVYGSQPSASTQNMPSASNICSAVKANIKSAVALAGLHPSALPEQTLKEEDVDYVIEGEGPLSLDALLKELQSATYNLTNVPGLWWIDEKHRINHTARAPLIQDLDHFFPVAAWDLLPMHIYRAHNWHCFDDINNRQPYGAIYTSLGCPFNCVFCCINAPFGKPGIRYRSPERVLEEIDILVQKFKVKNLKIVDELFILNPNHYLPILDGLIKRNYTLNIWAYARIDTIKPELLPTLKKAGINWLALGIESANPDVRDGATKQMHVEDIKAVVRKIQAHDIRVIGNYIFGLPDDTSATMKQTLDMAKDLNCEFANFYSAMAYPGSNLYNIALKANWQLPETWLGYSQHSFETLPLPTKHTTASDVLKFRDDAFHNYFSNPDYLNMLEKTFGKQVKKHILEITSTRLKRKF